MSLGTSCTSFGCGYQQGQLVALQSEDSKVVSTYKYVGRVYDCAEFLLDVCVSSGKFQCLVSIQRRSLVELGVTR